MTDLARSDTETLLRGWTALIQQMQDSLHKCEELRRSIDLGERGEAIANELIVMEESQARIIAEAKEARDSTLEAWKAMRVTEQSQKN